VEAGITVPTLAKFASGFTLQDKQAARRLIQDVSQMYDSHM